MLKAKRTSGIIILLILLTASVIYLCTSQLGSSPVMANESEDALEIPKVPIIMYHSVCNNKKVTSDYRITPKQFEEDLRYLSKNGYEGIFVSDIIAYVYEGAELPEKPIVITLDDGYLNNKTEVLPLLEKYDMRATISVVGQFAEDFSRTTDTNPLYAYLTWSDIKELNDSGRVEIGNHTYAMHEIGERRGCAKIGGESEEKYEKALSEDLNKLQNALCNNSGVTSLVFTYPYGFVSEESLPVIKKLGFLAALTCYEHINYINGTPEQLYKLGRFNRPPNISTEEFMKKLGI